MLNTSRAANPDCLIRSWICFRSISTVSRQAEAASPWHCTPFKPVWFLHWESQPSLSVRCSCWGMPHMSANCHHFWWNVSPVSNNPSLQAFTIQRSSISVTSGCRETCMCLVDEAAPPSCWYLARHFDSSLTQDDMTGCFRWRVR